MPMRGQGRALFFPAPDNPSQDGSSAASDRCCGPCLYRVIHLAPLVLARIASEIAQIGAHGPAQHSRDFGRHSLLHLRRLTGAGP